MKFRKKSGIAQNQELSGKSGSAWRTALWKVALYIGFIQERGKNVIKKKFYLAAPAPTVAPMTY